MHKALEDRRIADMVLPNMLFGCFVSSLTSYNNDDYW